MTFRVAPPFDGDQSVSRMYRMRIGDQITLINERNIKLGEYLPGTRLICIRLNKRDKWWQFWKPRYKSATFMYVGER